MLTKQKKTELIEKYSEILNKAKTLVYVKFKGLTVQDTEVLRKKLQAENISYNVVKKTLWNKALDNQNISAKISGSRPEVVEEMAVIAGQDTNGDLLAPARITNEFAKNYKNIFGILGGIFDGAFKDAKSMLEIANIPSREILLSKLAYLLKSPMQRLAIGIKKISDLTPPLSKGEGEMPQ